jgi:hypothetical protein
MAPHKHHIDSLGLDAKGAQKSLMHRQPRHDAGVDTEAEVALKQER